MRKTTRSPGEKIGKDVKRATRRQYSSEEKTKIVLNGLRGEDSIAVKLDTLLDACKPNGLTFAPMARN